MNWLERYRSKLKTPAEAVRLIRSGQRVYVHPGCAVPEVLVNAMCTRATDLENVEVIHLLTVGKSPYSAPEMEGHFRHNALFIGTNVRRAVQRGMADYTPCFLSEVPRLITSGRLPVDVARGCVREADRHALLFAAPV